MPARLFTARQWSKYLPYFEVQEMGSSYFFTQNKTTIISINACGPVLFIVVSKKENPF